MLIFSHLRYRPLENCALCSVRTCRRKREAFPVGAGSLRGRSGRNASTFALQRTAVDDTPFREARYAVSRGTIRRIVLNPFLKILSELFFGFWNDSLFF